MTLVPADCEVVVLTSRNMSELLLPPEDTGAEVLCHCVCSLQFSGDRLLQQSGITRLPQPAIIDGVPAASEYCVKETKTIEGMCSPV